MAKQISLSFKDTDRELALYEWLQSKVSKGAYIKEQLFSLMDAEQSGNVVTAKAYKEPQTKKQRGMSTLKFGMED